MRTQIGLYIEDSTAGELKDRARKVGCGIGDLGDLCIRYALDRLSEDALRKWAEKIPSRMGPTRGQPTKKERLALAAMQRLLNAGEAWRFSGREIARESGLYPTECFLALKQLQARGLVSGIADESNV